MLTGKWIAEIPQRGECYAHCMSDELVIAGSIASGRGKTRRLTK